jgi:hypothetical protein
MPGNAYPRSSNVDPCHPDSGGVWNRARYLNYLAGNVVYPRPPLQNSTSGSRERENLDKRGVVDDRYSGLSVAERQRMRMRE